MDSNIYLFVISSALLALSPGPDNIYVLTLGITKNKKAAIITTMGLCSGLIIHTLAVAFGVAVIFKTSAIAFDVVKYLGAAYLLYIAYQIFVHRKDDIHLDDTHIKLDYKKLFIKGFIMNILNPKVSIFFLAFLPQFVDKNSSNITLQIVMFGFIFMLVAFSLFSTIGIIANIFKKKVLEKKNFILYLNVITSIVLVVLSMGLAFSSN